MRVLDNSLNISFTQESLPSRPGLYDVRAIELDDGAPMLDGPVSPIGTVFLRATVRSLATAGIDLQKYQSGGMYYRLIDTGQFDLSTDRGGTFHYDTRRSPDEVIEEQEGLPVLRIVSAISSSGANINTIFSTNPEHHDKLAKDVLEQADPAELTQPPSGSLTLFDEKYDLHARPPAQARALGGTSLFLSAVFRAKENEVVACPALAEHRA